MKKIIIVHLHQQQQYEIIVRSSEWSKALDYRILPFHFSSVCFSLAVSRCKQGLSLVLSTRFKLAAYHVLKNGV
jgi:hypothetical protein